MRGIASEIASRSATICELICAELRTLAMRRRSSFLTRRTAIAPASTKYLRAMSSIPLVVRMTLAPAARIFSMRSCEREGGRGGGEERGGIGRR